ncbi:MAG: type VI secretion system baseplate subunit TssE [Planctomycetota bacterium]|jgi:type VI secretion system protein
MAREKSLLDRLSDLDSTQRSRIQPSAQEDLEALMDSIRSNLIRILNARHGMSEALPDYGLPALTDLTEGTGDHVTMVEASIRNAIERYEPRLERVRVARVENEDAPQVWSFRVDAIMKSQTGKHKVWYQTEVNGSGEFNVFD